MEVDRKSALSTEDDETAGDDYCSWDVRLHLETTYKNGNATKNADIHVLRDVQLALSKDVGIYVVSKVSSDCAYTYRLQCNAGDVVLEKKAKATSSLGCDKDETRKFWRAVGGSRTRKTCLRPGESFAPLYWLAEAVKDYESDENSEVCLVFEVQLPQGDASENENAVTPDIANHAHELIARSCVFDFSEKFPLAHDELRKAVSESASEFSWASTTEAAAINAEGLPICIEETPDGQRVLDLASCSQSMDFRSFLVSLWNLKKMQAKVHFGIFSTELSNNLKFFESVVNRIGFLVPRAESTCMSRAVNNIPSPADLRECTEASLLNEVQKDPMELKKVYEIEDEIEVQSVWSEEKKRLNFNDIGGAKAEQANVHWNWAQTDAEGYKAYTAALDTCKVRLKHTTQHKEALVMARLVQELTSACSNEKGCKVEKDGPLCPEGHGCLCSRPWTPKRGAAAGAAFFAASWPTYAALGALGGLIVGGPVGAVHGALVGLALPGKFEGAGAMGLLFSRSWSKECMCFPLECKYDSASESCTLQRQSGQHASHPYDWLPYPGQKCVNKEHKHFYEGSGPVCEMKSCTSADYNEPVPAEKGMMLFGKVGKHNGAIFNCPSVDGADVGAFIVKDQLPQPHLGIRALASNTIESRLNLLRKYYLKNATETVLESAGDSTT